jgi:hypothetical protein
VSDDSSTRITTADSARGAASDPAMSVTVIAVLTGIMLLLALIGAGATLANVTWAETYWLCLVPVYGLICTIAAWLRTRTLEWTVIRQILHWLAVGVTIAIGFSFLRRSGEQTSISTGLSSLLILALGCLLAGVHLEWMFALVGLLLLATAVVVSVAQEYMALAILIGVAGIAIFVVGHHFAKKWLA